MALIVETGAGLANAESYASVAEATAYFGGRNKADDWDAVDDKEAALRNATDYITQTYSGAWSGFRSRTEQALDWPRVDVPWDDDPSGAYPSNAIPAALKRACIELALRAGSGNLIEDLERETLSETVDVISVTYAPGGSRQKRYTVAERLLRPLLNGGSTGMIPMERS